MEILVFFYLILLILFIVLGRAFCTIQEKYKQQFEEKIASYEQFRQKPAVFLRHINPAFVSANGQKLVYPQEADFKLRDIHPASQMPTNGFMIQFDAESYPTVVGPQGVKAEQRMLQVWFRPMNDVLLDVFKVESFGGGNVELSSSKFGTLNLMKDVISAKELKKIDIGDKVAIKQHTSWSPQFGYRIYFTGEIV